MPSLSIIEPAFAHNCIPIVFATDNRYAPQLYVAISSLFSNASSAYNYDIIILTSDLSSHHKMMLLNDFTKDNASIRFYDVDIWIKENQDSFHIHNWGGAWHSISVYFRFVIPEICSRYDKVIFLDSDLVIPGDISKMYDIDLGDYYLGAVQDLSRQLEGEKIAQYVESTLRILPANYFNAGVLLLNIKKMRGKNFPGLFLECLKQLGKPLLQDQDVFNVVFKNKVKYLDYKYNCLLWNSMHCHPSYDIRLPQRLLDSAHRAAQNPIVLHYAGIKKPWKSPHLEYAHYFWEYARKTPYYEQLIWDNLLARIPATNKNASTAAKSPIPLSILKDALQQKKLYWRYVRYRILSKITFGKSRKKYWTKKCAVRKRLMDIRSFLGKK